MIVVKLRIAINNSPEKFVKAAFHMPETAKKSQEKCRLAMRNMHFIQNYMDFVRTIMMTLHKRNWWLSIIWWDNCLCELIF